MSAQLHADVAQQNRQLLGKLLVIVVLMTGFGFAMVPMYRQICDALGITQTRTVGSGNTQVDKSRTVTVELVASSAGLPWTFVALDRAAKVHPGELTTVRYRVENTLGRPVTAHAVMNTAPSDAARWIAKTECFCFSDQTLAAGEVREMPVVFRLSPDAPKDLGTISLSYTFFEIKPQSGAVKAAS
jgi:cytochrome c oxidase assembly protein subunit 11